MISENLSAIYKELPSGVELVAVSKFHPLEAILEAAAAGQKVFGESRPQELEKKVNALAALSDAPEVHWQFIGHLQTNKLKMVLPYVELVQSVDSLHLLEEIDKWGRANGRVINVLLEMHVAAEDTKQGFYEEEILDLLLRRAGAPRQTSASQTPTASGHTFDGGSTPVTPPGGRLATAPDSTLYPNVRICGLMGMATNTDNEEDIRADFGRIADFFDYLRDLCPELTDFTELSIGMSGDWKIALEYGATMVRIGTAIFGEREY